MNYTLSGDDESYAFKVVQAGPQKIVARINVEPKVQAGATFSLAVYDSIDKDYTSIGSTNAETEETFEGAVLVNFQGDFASDDVEVVAVELVAAPHSIHFGYVEPDYSEDYYDDR